MKRPDFNAIKVEQQERENLQKTKTTSVKNEEINSNEKNDISIYINNMIDKKTGKIKSLRDYKQELLREISKIFSIPTDDMNCNIMRENLRNLSVDVIRKQLNEIKSSNSSY